MKTYVYYTPSHEVFLDQFIKSCPKDLELIFQIGKQECTGRFLEEGWMRSMVQKVQHILRGIEENWGGTFLHADVDVQFFTDKIKDRLLHQLEIGGKDIAAQADRREDNPKSRKCCAGFFVAKANRNTKSIFEAILKEIKRPNNPKNRHDQWWMDKLGHHSIYLLPRKQYWSHRKLWNRGDPIDPPPEIIMHHANWITGVDKKVSQLRLVKTIVEMQRGKK